MVLFLSDLSKETTQSVYEHQELEINSSMLMLMTFYNIRNKNKSLHNNNSNIYRQYSKIRTESIDLDSLLTEHNSIFYGTQGVSYLCIHI